jgi:hypothetical protein
VSAAGWLAAAGWALAGFFLWAYAVRDEEAKTFETIARRILERERMLMDIVERYIKGPTP